MRGVSPIVSTILMVAIAIAAAVVVYYITMDVITKQGTQLEQQTSAGQDQIVIEEVSAPTGGTVTAYIRNVGDSDVTVSAAYIYNEDGTTLVDQNTSLNVTIAAGQVSSVDTGISTPTTSGTYVLKVVTTNGGIATKTFKVG